jgi:hypothetical protein
MFIIFSLLKVKLPFADHYNLYGGGNTDGYALCFNAIYACRMQFSLSYNFLLTLHNEDLYKKTGLFGVLGVVSICDILIFYIYARIRTITNSALIFIKLEVSLLRVLPIAMLLIAVMNVFDTCGKIMQRFGIDVSKYPDEKNSEHLQMVKDGKHLIERGRRKGLDASLSSRPKSTSLKGGDKSRPFLR